MISVIRVNTKCLLNEHQAIFTIFSDIIGLQRYNIKQIQEQTQIFLAKTIHSSCTLHLCVT